MASDVGVLIIIYNNAAIIIIQEIEIRHTVVYCVSQETATDIPRMSITGINRMCYFLCKTGKVEF